MSRAILDTSVLIARQQGRPLERPLPDNVAISVVSIAELEVGDFSDFARAVSVVHV